ncbi:unnamed protein product [Auanema sp. JU1783]|nr:unnamed protein product [Auanema sp. JU1783]
MMNKTEPNFLSPPSFSKNLKGVERSKSLNSALKKCNRSAEEKKVVSFADSMGLDLCHIRPIFPYNTSDEELFSSSPPVVNPTIRSSNQSVTQLRNTSSLNCPRYLQLKSSPYPVWKDHLQVQRDLANKAKNNGICLKSSNVIGMTFSGVISVLNISYSKQVFVRYTVDKWTSFVEMPAQFLNSNHQEKLDYFTFSIFLPSTIPVGAMCEFCLKYVCEGKEFWDNNDGSNYVLEVRTLAASYLDIQRDFDHPRFY